MQDVLFYPPSTLTLNTIEMMIFTQMQDGFKMNWETVSSLYISIEQC